MDGGGWGSGVPRGRLLEEGEHSLSDQSRRRRTKQGHLVSHSIHSGNITYTLLEFCGTAISQTSFLD